MSVAACGPRLSFLPAGVLFDQRLSLRAMQVLAVLCCSTDGNGICTRSQVKIAEQLKIARATVYRSIEALVRAGWLEKVAGVRPDGGRCSYTYRVINQGKDAELFASAEEPRHVHADRAQAQKMDRVKGQAMPAKEGSYNNESLKTKEEEDGTGTEEAAGANFLPYQQAAAAGRYRRACAKFLGSLGLSPEFLRGGFDPVMGWFAAGCHLEMDVKPAILKVMARAPEPPRSLHYFSRAVVAAKKSREECADIPAEFIPDGKVSAVRRERAQERGRAGCLAAIEEVCGGFGT